MRQTLPIDPYLDEIAATVGRRRALVVVAAPGAGKTTRVAPALLADGPVVLLQPRRVAARALARRIAAEGSWTIGEEVGWQVRHERRFSARTRLLVATEGVLTARMQADPLLSEFRTVILDEFHERSLHADLALALARQAAEARDDLRIVVMSATLDAAPVAAFLGGCPVLEVPGRSYPVEVEHAVDQEPESILDLCLHTTHGNVLWFLPGAPEIRRLQARLEGRIRAAGCRVLPLHGSLPAEAQEAALAPSPQRKVVLATNIAETSLTLEGVGMVVDTGVHKVMRRDPGPGIDRLEIERISRDSAEQRAGRAGRTGPGRVLRLWDPRLELAEHREPEIRRVDLVAPALSVLAWGADPLQFGWFEPPPAEGLREALDLLDRLGARERGRISELGRKLARFALHPRLARTLLAAGGTPTAAAACAALAEGWRPRDPGGPTSSDVLSSADRLHEAPQRVRRAAAALRRTAARQCRLEPVSHGEEETALRRALLAGYPDRLARRRNPGSRRLLLSSGHGAELSRDSGVLEGEFLVALDVVAGPRGPGSEARVRMASRVEPAWLEPTGIVVDHLYDPDSRSVRAVERTCYDRLVLVERQAAVDPAIAAELLASEMGKLDPDPETAELLRRLKFARIEIDLPRLRREASEGQTRLPRLDLRGWLPFETLRRLDRVAPAELEVPSGRSVRLEYRSDGSVAAAVKLQELFGLADTPRIGPDEQPVVLSLLAPNGRPVQTTSDLRSFWNTTYSEVRKQLRGRYPKHPWPEDPWTAEPTARTRRRRS